MQIQNHARNKELFQAFKKAFSRDDVHSYREAVEYARNSKCSQFFVSSEYAWLYIVAKEKGLQPKRGKTYFYIFEIIYKRYLKLKERYEMKGFTDKFIFSMAYTSPAPCFFISFRHADHIIRNMKRYGRCIPRKRYDKKYRIQEQQQP